MDNTIIILVPIFILLLVIIFHAIRSASVFSGMSSFILSVCVTILAIMGIAECLRNSITVILIPYTAMALTILLLLLLSLVARYFQRSDNHLSKLARKTNLPKKHDYQSRREYAERPAEKVSDARHLSRRHRQPPKLPKTPK